MQILIRKLKQRKPHDRIVQVHHHHQIVIPIKSNIDHLVHHRIVQVRKMKVEQKIQQIVNRINQLVDKCLQHRVREKIKQKMR